MTYPILEFDPAPEAMIEPSQVIEPRDVPEHCLICFFGEIIEQVSVAHQAKVVVENRWEDGPHNIYEITHHNQRLAYFHPGVGAPIAASLLEEAIAFGCRKFIVCGGCGVLEPDIAVGNLIVVSSAVRDEGVSYHYLPPDREVQAHPQGVAALEAALKERALKERALKGRALKGRALPYQVGKTWTTDAPFRETAAKIATRRAEGCVVVEMEAAGLMAVAAFRGVILGQVLYGGDDLSGSEWDHRDWQSQEDIREQLFWLAAEACLRL